MSEQTPKKNLLSVNPDVSRRDFLRLSGLAAAGVMVAACGTPPAPGSDAAPAAEAPAAEAPAADASAAADVKEVAREKTLVLTFNGGEGGFHRLAKHPLEVGHGLGVLLAWPTFSRKRLPSRLKAAICGVTSKPISTSKLDPEVVTAARGITIWLMFSVR